MFWANKYVQSMAAYPIVKSIIRSLGVGDSSVTAMVTLSQSIICETTALTRSFSLSFSHHRICSNHPVDNREYSTQWRETRADWANTNIWREEENMVLS